MPLPKEVLAYHAAQAPEDARICRKIAKAIESGLPGAECKVWHRHPVWFIDGNPIVGYSKIKDAIRLMFWSGQSFDEPGLSPEPPGTKFKSAGVRFSAAAEVNATDLRHWLKKSAECQWDYKNIVKRKGRLLRLK